MQLFIPETIFIIYRVVDECVVEGVNDDNDDTVDDKIIIHKRI
jgi:hypothetical protein